MQAEPHGGGGGGGGKQSHWSLRLLRLCACGGGGSGGGGRGTKKQLRKGRWKLADVAPPNPAAASPDQATPASEVPLPLASVTFRCRQYRLERLLGTGAYGEVYLARHPATGDAVAVKRHTRARDGFKDFAASQLLARALVGTGTGGGGSHPLVVRLLGHVTQGAERLTMMELCPCGDLQSLLPRLRPSADETEAAFFVVEVAEALGYLHERGVCHLDVRPCNVLLSRRCHCRLADFSIAELRPSAETATATASAAAFRVRLSSRGHWLPPEIRPELPSPAGRFTDWYSLGALAATLAAGGSAAGFSSSFRHFVSRLLLRDPDARLGSQGGLAEVLSHGFITGRAAQLLRLPAGVASVREFVRRQRLRPPERVQRVLQPPESY